MKKIFAALVLSILLTAVLVAHAVNVEAEDGERSEPICGDCELR